MTPNLYPHVYKLWLLSRFAEHRSFKLAAADASITVSALSQSIASLERVLGKTLVVRARGAMALTEDGADVLARAEPIFRAVSALTRGHSQQAPTKPQRLRFGLYETIASRHLPRLIPVLRREFPSLSIHLRTARSSTLEQLLRAGELDAIVVARDPDQGGSTVDTLAKGEFGLFVSPEKHPLGWEAVRCLGLATLAPARGAHPAYLRRFLDDHARFLRQRGVPPRIAMTSDSIETLLRLAAAGFVVSALPLRAGRRFPGELVQMHAPAQTRLDRGAHQLCLVTRSSVDHEVRRVLRSELTAVLRDIN
jgi:LysR family hydrogen peroxide-inducible transcriptional activator